MIEPFKTLWALAMADDPATIARLEAETGATQAEAVTEFVEESCWAEDLPQFQGGKGTAAERRAGLLAAYAAQEAQTEAISQDEGPPDDDDMGPVIALADIHPHDIIRTYAGEALFWALVGGVPTFETKRVADPEIRSLAQAMQRAAIAYLDEETGKALAAALGTFLDGPPRPALSIVRPADPVGGAKGPQP